MPSYIQGILVSASTSILARDGYPRTFRVKRDKKGNRVYTVRHLVLAGVRDGPRNVLACSGLPRPGSTWNFMDDVDTTAWCTNVADVNLHEEKEGENSKVWTVDQEFSTIPPDVCFDEELGDPLLAPQKVSISTIKYNEEATYDMFGLPIVNSSHEMVRGPQAEFEASRISIRIEQNVASLGLSLVKTMMNTVNQLPMWGLSARMIKLSDFQAEKKYKGGVSFETGTGTGGCRVYWTRTFTFDTYARIDPQSGGEVSGFDRYLRDEGTKTLIGSWNTSGAFIPGSPAVPSPDPTNPAHFQRAVDADGNYIRTLLNRGVPAGAAVITGTHLGGDAGVIVIQKYEESNFFTLGIPTDLEL